MRFMICLLLSIVLAEAKSQPKTDAFLKNILFSNPDPILQNVLAHPDSFRVQIIYTQIDRDKKNIPSFRNFYFNADSLLYFNPASTVKLPLACLALETLNLMHVS